MVLVVDDDPAVRRLLRRILLDDFGVLEAGDGEEAIEIAKAERPAVVLLDLHMPRLDGYGALLRMKAEPALRSTPVLIVTGAATSGEDAAMCLRDGAHDFVRKPFEETELLARVRAAHRHKAFEDELRLRNRELEHFASTAAHDLKQPLSAIGMLVDLLGGMHVDTSTQMRLVDDIRSLAEQGNRLIADLLAIAREDWANAALVHPVDVELIVKNVIDECRLGDAKVTVGGSWTKLVLPEVVLHSIFANLISNAGHYGRGPDGTLDLEIHAEATPERLEVVVADRGPGVDPELAPRIFEPFASASNSGERNPHSSGLGLAVVARTLERYGGTIELLDGCRVGTAFRLTLPAPRV